MSSMQQVPMLDRSVSKSLLRQKGMVAQLLADSFSPYDSSDPVLISSMLENELDSFLAKAGVEEEEFMEDFTRARGKDGTPQDRRRFIKKYGFNPLSVVFREHLFAPADEELQSIKIQLLEVVPERAGTEKEYKWWEGQLNDLFSIGYHINDYRELKKWFMKDAKNRMAMMQYSHNICSLIYRICTCTNRIDFKKAEQMISPHYLPTWDEVNNAFRLDLPHPDSWSPVPVLDMVKKARRVDDFNRDDSGIYHNMTFTTFTSHFMDLHQSTHPFKHFCKVTGTFMMPTKEYVDSLAEYLVQRAKAYEALDVPILEVGAGTGRLAYHLNESEAFKKAGLKCIATDIRPQLNPFMVAYPRSERSKFQAFDIEAIDQKSAADKYNPCIVLSQMMPNQVDWTQDWRDNKCILEYVLVGPADSPLCGYPWETWGSYWGEVQRLSFTPKYLSDGFRKVYVDSISKYLINQDDHPQCNSFCRVVSFRRMGRPEFLLRYYGWHYGQVLWLFLAVLAFTWYITPMESRDEIAPETPLGRK